MLTTGSTVYARIVATNDIGDSIQSSISNGVIITYSYVPNAPISLTRDSLTTTTT